MCNNSRLLKRDGKYSRLQHFRIELNIFHHVGKPDIIAQKLQCKHATIAHNIADTLTDTQPYIISSPVADERKATPWILRCVLVLVLVVVWN